MEGKASSEAEDNRALIAESVTPPTVWVLLMIHCAYVTLPCRYQNELRETQSMLRATQREKETLQEVLWAWIACCSHAVPC